jgi:uncharacterized membrane protein
MVALGAFVGSIVLLSILAAIAIPVAIIWLIVVVVRNLSGPRRPSRDIAVEELRYRLARGEITEAQFEQGMWDLGYEKVR